MAALVRRRALSLFARRFLPLRLRGLRFHVCVDIFLPLPILPRELVGRHAPAVLFDEPPVSLLAGQTWIDLICLHGLARGAAGAVDLLLGAPLDVDVAALALLVGRQMFSHLRGERVEVGEGPALSLVEGLLLRQRGSHQHQGNQQRPHS